MLALGGGLAAARAGSGFSAPKHYPVNANSLENIAIADLNGDGRKDIITSSELSEELLILYGNRTGFSPAQPVPVGVDPHFFAVHDMNGDKRPDLVVDDPNPTGQVLVLLAKRHGFADPVAYPAGASPQELAIGDLNGDGHPDVVTPNPADNAVSVLLGTKHGTLKAPRPHTTDSPFRVVTGDFNGDGKLDVATSTYENGNDQFVNVLKGNGKGGLKPGPSFDLGMPRVRGLMAGRFTADRRPDIVATGCGVADPSVLLIANGKHGLKPPESFLNSDGACGDFAAAGDLNGDGRADVVTVLNYNGPDSGDVSVLYAKRGGFAKAKVYGGTSLTASDPYSVAVGRVNGDKHPDIAYPDYDGAQVTVFHGKG